MAGGSRGRMGGRGDRGGRNGRGGFDGRGGGGTAMARGGEPTPMDFTAGVPSAGHNNVRKRLISSDGTVNIRGQPLPNLVGKEADTVLLLEGSSTSDPSLEPALSTPGKAPIVKRRRQDRTVEDDGVKNMNEAASLEEGRRA